MLNRNLYLFYDISSLINIKFLKFHIYCEKSFIIIQFVEKDSIIDLVCIWLFCLNLDWYRKWFWNVYGWWLMSLNWEFYVLCFIFNWIIIKRNCSPFFCIISEKFNLSSSLSKFYPWFNELLYYSFIH